MRMTQHPKGQDCREHIVERIKGKVIKASGQSCPTGKHFKTHSTHLTKCTHLQGRNKSPRKNEILCCIRQMSDNNNIRLVNIWETKILKYLDANHMLIYVN